MFIIINKEEILKNSNYQGNSDNEVKGKKEKRKAKTKTKKKKNKKKKNGKKLRKFILTSFVSIS